MHKRLAASLDPLAQTQSEQCPDRELGIPQYCSLRLKDALEYLALLCQNSSKQECRKGSTVVGCPEERKKAKKGDDRQKHLDAVFPGESNVS